MWDPSPAPRRKPVNYYEIANIDFLRSGDDGSIEFYTLSLSILTPNFDPKDFSDRRYLIGYFNIVEVNMFLEVTD